MIAIKEIVEQDKKSYHANEILRALPEWFGIEESLVDYVNQVKELPFLVAISSRDDEGANPAKCSIPSDDKEVGFLAIKIHNAVTAEIFVMGVLKENHRKGIGKMLVDSCVEYCRVKELEFLTVKTLDESNPDKNYAKTREFYLREGFKPLEVFPLLWDKSNPCLFMVKRIEL